MSTPAGKQPQAAPAVPQHTDIQGSASLTGGHVHARPPATGRYLALLSLGALGVVYGDIGTSPLYALRESFHGTHAVEPTPANIYGVLSLVFWALIIVITIKYIVFILRADNHGEGGILALTALATPIRPLIASQARWLVRLGVFGAALLVRRRHHHAGYLGAERGGRLNRRHAVVSAVCRPADAGHTGRPVCDPEPRHGHDRPAIWPGDAGLVRRAGDPGHQQHRR